MVCAPRFEDTEIGLVGFAGRRGLGRTDEIVSLLDKVFKTGRKMKRGDEFVLHERTPKMFERKNETGTPKPAKRGWELGTTWWG
jgi:hypothetical protein